MPSDRQRASASLFEPSVKTARASTILSSLCKCECECRARAGTATASPKLLFSMYVAYRFDAFSDCFRLNFDTVSISFRSRFDTHLFPSSTKNSPKSGGTKAL